MNTYFDFTLVTKLKIPLIITNNVLFVNRADGDSGKQFYKDSEIKHPSLNTY